MVYRTSRLLQILHRPPSHLRVELMRDNVRFAPRRVKREATRSCGLRHNRHNIARNWPISRDLRFQHDRSSGGAFPRAFRRYSAESRQDFHRVIHRVEIRVSSENPPLPRRFCACFSCAISARVCSAFSAAFSYVFRPLKSGRSHRKKGERKAGDEICGKHDFRIPGHYRWWSMRRVHTNCGTWNIFNSCRWLPRRRIHRLLQASLRVQVPRRGEVRSKRR